jgi:ribosomal protein S18 acetylase RimI-like enzyme
MTDRLARNSGTLDNLHGPQEAMNIEYSDDRTISTAEFIDVLRRSTLGERRPIDDLACIDEMLQHGNLLCTAWDSDKLVGVARSLTDFSYCCYLSDLAVDLAYQCRGIGKELIRVTQARLGPKCKIVLLAAPKAVDYYPKIGFTQHHSAWILGSSDLIG